MDLGHLRQLCMEISCYATPIASPAIKASRFPLQWTLNYHVASLPSAPLSSPPLLFHSPISLPLPCRCCELSNVQNNVFSSQWAFYRDALSNNLLSFQNSNRDHGLYLFLQCWGLTPGHFAWLASVCSIMEPQPLASDHGFQSSSFFYPRLTLLP